MEIKLEDITSILVAIAICGSVAYEVRAPIWMVATRVFRGISPRIRKPIEELATGVYRDVVATKEGLGKLLYPDYPYNPLVPAYS